MRVYKKILQHKWLLSLLLALYIFRGAFVNWIVEYICPIVSQVEDGDVWIQMAVLGVVVLAYVVSCRRLLSERDIFVSRYGTLLLLGLAYIIFRTYPKFIWYGISGWSVNYIDCAWIAIGLIEIILLVLRIRYDIQEKEKRPDGSVMPFLSDTPCSRDDLARGEYAKQLVDKINAIRATGQDSIDAFTILLNEHYGNGKTSFLLQVQQLANEKGIEVCWFRPWLYDSNKTLIVQLIRLIREKLGDGDKPLLKMLDRYARVLSSVEKWEWLSIFEQEALSVETQLADIKTRLREVKRPMVVLIDDVDRLQNDELLRLLQLIRNIADFPYLYYIIAGDKEALMNRLQEAGVAEPGEYLKKFFNLELSFPADDEYMWSLFKDELFKVLEYYNIKPFETWNYILVLRYKNEIFANLRDVKRFLNILDYTLANYKAHKMLDEICMRDVAGVCIIQCIDSQFYRILRDHNEYILEYSDWLLRIRKDFAKAFMDRLTVQTAEEIISNQNTQTGNNTLQHGDTIKTEDFSSLGRLQKWSRPMELEIMGSILDTMFGSSVILRPRTRICYPTEYFKYFATTYKKKEMSNAEIVGMMTQETVNYRKGLRKVFVERREESFRHKLQWYVQSQSYERIIVLEKVLEAYEMEKPFAGNKSEGYMALFFNQRYAGIILNIFHTQSGETKEQCAAEWDMAVSWLFNQKSHERRINVLSVLSLMTKEMTSSSYIFADRKAVKQCVEKSELEFVTIVWNARKYRQEVYPLVKRYREIDPAITEYIQTLLSEKKENEKAIFLYHLLMLEKGKLKWNMDFITNVIGQNFAFSRRELPWNRIVVPEKWRYEFETFKMQEDLTDEEIKGSAFLQAALVYWKKKNKR